MNNLHLRALDLAAKIKTAEIDLLIVLQEIDFTKMYRQLGYPSLFSYAQRGLGLNEAFVSQLITVSRKAKQVPELQKALEEGKLSTAKAKSICAVINSENAEQWITTTLNSTAREIERAVKGDHAIKKVPLTLETLALLARVQEVAAQKSNVHADLEKAIVEAAKAYLEKNDPLNRALHVKGKREAFRRDAGACQFKLPDGKICGARQWVHAHHIQHRAAGGGDEAENLITLCSAHHRILHGQK